MNEKLTKKAEETGLKLYTQQPQEETAFIRWWLRLAEEGKLDEILAPHAHSLAGFFNTFAPPATTVYSLDEDNKIWFVAWFDPMRDAPAAFMGLWIDEAKRTSRRALRTLQAVYRCTLAICPVIFGITHREELLVPHEKAGYAILLRFPKLNEGDPDSWLVALTRERFEESKLNSLET